MMVTTVTRMVTSKLNNIFRMYHTKNVISRDSIVYNIIKVTKVTKVTYYNSILVKGILCVYSCIIILQSEYTHFYSRIYAQKCCNLCNFCNFVICRLLFACNLNVTGYTLEML